MLFQIYFTVHAFFVLLQIIFLQLACTLPALGFIVLVIFPGLVPESPRFQICHFFCLGWFPWLLHLGLVDKWKLNCCQGGCWRLVGRMKQKRSWAEQRKKTGSLRTRNRPMRPWNRLRQKKEERRMAGKKARLEKERLSRVATYLTCSRRSISANPLLSCEEICTKHSLFSV